MQEAARRQIGQRAVYIEFPLRGLCRGKIETKSHGSRAYMLDERRRTGRRRNIAEPVACQEKVERGKNRVEARMRLAFYGGGENPVAQVRPQGAGPAA